MANLYSVAERIVTVHRMAALFMPWYFRRVRAAVVFFTIEFFENRRIKLRRDAKVDMGSLDGARAALGDLIDFAQDHKLSRVGHGEGRLLLARNLS
jgi:hypothetical protein